MDPEAVAFMAKAMESLASAESDYSSRGFNSCANRCYYACFQAALAALIQEGIRPTGRLGHAFVQSRFAGVLIERRKRYPNELRRALAQAQELRDEADYRPGSVTEVEAVRSLRRSRAFVDTVRRSFEEATR